MIRVKEFEISYWVNMSLENSFDMDLKVKLSSSPCMPCHISENGEKTLLSGVTLLLHLL